MMTQKHVLNYTTDYVLGLLPPHLQRQVEQHTAHCAHCRQQLQTERHLSEAIRTTLNQAAQSSPSRLRQLMPAPPIVTRTPPHRQPNPLRWPLQKQLAPLYLTFLLVLGGMGAHWVQTESHWPMPMSAFVATTATQTKVPTTTPQTRTLTTPPQHPHNTVVLTLVAPTNTAVATPAPNPTPIAALPSTQ